MTAGPQSAGQGDGAGSPAVVDEAVAAADGTRAAARWIASALGAVPSLAVLASIVRAPGGSGFDPTKLAVGVGLAALGAVIGVLGFAWVLVPVPLQDDDIRNLDLKRIPGQPYTTFDELDKGLQKLRQAATREDYDAAESLADAKRAEAQAQRDDVAAAAAEAKAAAAPADNDIKTGAEQARARADRAKAEAAALTAEAAADADALGTWTAQISRRDAIRSDAYRLKAADVVRRRFIGACVAAVGSVALIAAGVVLLGLAPNPPAATAPALPRLVTLTLSGAGRHALHCPARSLQALQTGGSAAAPTVITLPAPGCPSRTVVFTTVSPRPLGTVSVPQPISGG